FLMVVMLVSIAVFSVIKSEAILLNLLARILLIPVVAGISYEVIRFSAKCFKRVNNELRAVGMRAWLFAILTTPGLWLQNVTTQEPSDDQLEVAIYALNESLSLEKIAQNTDGLQPATAEGLAAD